MWLKVILKIFTFNVKGLCFGLCPKLVVINNKNK